MSSLPATSFDVDEPRTCLIISSDPEDAGFFLMLLGLLGWDCTLAGTWSEAREHLERRSVQVVIARQEEAVWKWTEMVRLPWPLSRAPKLIVTSRTADDHNWTDLEAIDAYDVLMEPLDEEEVVGVVAMAQTAWLDEWSVPEHALVLSH